MTYTKAEKLNRKSRRQDLLKYVKLFKFLNSLVKIKGTMTNPAAYWRNKKDAFAYVNKIGTLTSVTNIHNPPMHFGKHAYWVGIVTFDTGEKKTGQLITEGKTPQIGDQVIGVARKTQQATPESVISYSVKFKIR